MGHLALACGGCTCGAELPGVVRKNPHGLDLVHYVGLDRTWGFGWPGHPFELTARVPPFLSSFCSVAGGRLPRGLWPEGVHLVRIGVCVGVTVQ